MVAVLEDREVDQVRERMERNWYIIPVGETKILSLRTGAKLIDLNRDAAFVHLEFSEDSFALFEQRKFSDVRGTGIPVEVPLTKEERRELNEKGCL